MQQGSTWEYCNAVKCETQTPFSAIICVACFSLYSSIKEQAVAGGAELVIISW